MYEFVKVNQLEIGERGDVGVEGGNGFDEAGDGEGVADASGAADEMQRAFFAGQADGDAHERGDAGAIDLRDAVEIDDDLACAASNDGLQGVGELLARLADCEAAVDFEHIDAVGLADVDLHWGAVGHRIGIEKLFLTTRVKPSVRPVWEGR